MDPNGNLVERRSAGGEVTQFVYDELDRRSVVRFPAQGAVGAQFTYDDANRPAPGAGPNGRGRLMTAESPGGSETFSYDELGRVISKRIRPVKLLGRELVFNYAYRCDGQWASVTYPEPAPGSGRLFLPYEYDGFGRLAAIPGFASHTEHNNAGQRTRLTYGNGVSQVWDYDRLTSRLAALRVRDSAGDLLLDRDYQYDFAGNLLAVNSKDPQAVSAFSYDDVYRLSGASVGSTTWTYDYDALGNLLQKSDTGAYQYDAAGRLAGADGRTFEYSPAGQITSVFGIGSAAKFTYDPLGRLLSIAQGPDTMACTIDHSGRRVAVERSAGGPGLSLTPDDLLSIEDGITYAWIVDGPLRLARLRLGSNDVVYLHPDHLGSTALVTDPGGEVLQRTCYDPFGVPLGGASSTPGTPELAFGGGSWDAWSGLYHLGAREYDPRLGRFLAADAAVPELFGTQSWNRYAYCANNPLRYVDPSGNWFLEDAFDWFADHFVEILAVAVIAAVVVLSAGAATPLAAALGVSEGFLTVAAGAAVGGIMGGIYAHQAGGNILLGVLVGMVIGGAAAYAGTAISAGQLTPNLAKESLQAMVVNGAMSGIVNGAAIGISQGFAGGQGDLGTILEGMCKGMAVGMATGMAYGFGKYAVQQGWLDKIDPRKLFGDGPSSSINLSWMRNPATEGFVKAAATEFATQLLTTGDVDKGVWMAGLGGGFCGAVDMSGVIRPGQMTRMKNLGAELFSASNGAGNYTDGFSNPKVILDYADQPGKVVAAAG